MARRGTARDPHHRETTPHAAESTRSRPWLTRRRRARRGIAQDPDDQETKPHAVESTRTGPWLPRRHRARRGRVRLSHFLVVTPDAMELNGYRGPENARPVGVQ